MTEQGITQEDERWITERLNDDLEPVAWVADMRAAIARGREQGRATCEYERELLDIARKQRDGALTEVKRLQREIADDYQNVMAPLVDMLGKAVQDTHFAWSGHALDAARALIAERDRLREEARRERENARAFSADIKQALLARAEKAEADRDRLAKRCEELEATTLALSAARAPDQKRISELSQRCAELDEVVKVLRREGQLPRDIGELNRLAALEQRVGVLETRAEGCITQDEYRTRLAALRSPGDGAPDLDARDLRNLRDSYKGIAQVLADAEIEPGHSQPDSVRLLVAALATARRERDDLARTLGAQIDEVTEKLHAAEIERSEALAEAGVARRERDEAVDALVQMSVRCSRDAEIAGWRESAKAMTGELATLRASLAEAQGEVALIGGKYDQLRKRNDAVENETIAMKRKLDTAQETEKGWQKINATIAGERDEARDEVERLTKLVESAKALRDVDCAFNDVTTRERDEARTLLRVTEMERGEAQELCDTLRSRIAELEARDREARYALLRHLVARSEAYSLADGEDSAGVRALTEAISYVRSSAGTPPADPARGLIERAVEALAQWHGPWRGAITVESLENLTEPLLADLRAYLGGGT